MEIRRLSDDFAVSPQITVEDLPAIWEAGYRTLISNRPDGEETGQTDFARIEEAARKIGFEVFHIPAVSGRAAMPHAIQTRKALENAPKPVFAYCRTGTRCTVIWSLMMLGELEDADILASAAAAGYDMSPLIHVD